MSEKLSAALFDAAADSEKAQTLKKLLSEISSSSESQEQQSQKQEAEKQEEEGEENSLLCDFLLKTLNEDQMTLLQVAAEADATDCVKVILDSLNDNNNNNKKKKFLDAMCEGGGGASVTALHYACFSLNAEVLQALIDAGANPNCQDLTHRETPLHFLAQAVSGQVSCKQAIKCARILLASKSSCCCALEVNAKNKSGETALHKSTVSPFHVDFVNFLLDEAKADLEAEDGNSQTPLWHAGLGGSSDAAVCKCLIQKGANTKLVDKASGLSFPDALMQAKRLDVLEELMA